MQTKIKILLVEDVQADRIMITRSIQQAGYDAEMKFAENIDDALTLAYAHTFDCILLDYFYPTAGNGLDFIKTYQAHGGVAPIIMVTSHNELSLAVESMKSGASDYISKQDLCAEQIVKSFNYILRLKDAEQSRMDAERALMESEMRMKSIIERSPVIVFTIDGGGFFKLFKGQGAASINVKQEQIIGQNIQDVGHLLPVRFNNYQEALAGKELTHRVEINNHFFDVNYIPVCNSQGKVSSMMGVAIDITNFKRNEVQLQNTIEVREAESRIKEQFLANISHEIRTPIHGIICLNDFVLKTNLTNDQRKYLDLVQRSADNLLVIVNDILDLSKIQAHKMTFEEIEFDINDAIQTSIATFTPMAIEKNIGLDLIMDENIPSVVSGDPVRLTQIINNLMGNAIKFTEQGSVKISIRCSDLSDHYSMIEFQVQDTGIGIPTPLISTIFDSFSQAGNDISRKYGGTGLGLTIAKQLVEQQNGTISVESKLNEGTTFRFNVPYKKGNPLKKINLSEKHLTMENTSTKKINILVAEDNDINRFIIKKMIDDWGYHHEFAVTGHEVVDKAAKADFDIILMDVEMPEMNGYEATEFIRKELPAGKNAIPIIAMTGHAMSGEKEKCINAGMTDYISKPFHSDDLKKKIIECVDNSTRPAGPPANDSPAAQRLTNMSFLVEISDGNDAFYRDFITLFLNSAPASITEMETAMKNKDWEAVRMTAHKIKPSLNYVGLTDLNKAAARIEDLSKRLEHLDEIPVLLNAIRTTCEQAYGELRQELLKVAA